MSNIDSITGETDLKALIDTRTAARDAYKKADAAETEAYKEYLKVTGRERKTLSNRLIAAQEAYDKTVGPAQDALDEATATAEAIYEVVEAEAQEVYNITVAAAQETHRNAITPKRKRLDMAIAIRQEAYAKMILAEQAVQQLQAGGVKTDYTSSDSRT